MVADYSHIDNEVLGRMMQVVKQNHNLSDDQLATLQKAVEKRKKQLEDKLSHVKKGEYNEAYKRSCLEIYSELITLGPDNYEYYKEAGWWSRALDDHHAAIGYYTSALQVVDDDPEKIWELYKERAHSFLALKDFASTLADGKMALRFKCLTPKDLDAIGHESNYKSALFYICEGLKGTGNPDLAEEIDTIRKFAEGGKEGLNDGLIEEFLQLLNVSVSTKSGVSSDATFPRINAVKQSISNDPSEVRKRQLKVQFYQEYEWGDQDFSKLLQMMKELIALEPTNYRYHAAAGEICRNLRDYATAVTYYSTALSLVDTYSGDAWWNFQTRTEHLFRLYRMRAHAFRHLKNEQKAFQDYEMALRCEPHNYFASELASSMISCLKNVGNLRRKEEVANCFEKIFGFPLPEDQYPKDPHEYAEDGIGFVEFSEAGTDKGVGERVAQSVFLDFGYSAEERREEENKAATALAKLEQLFSLMRA